MSLNTYLTYDTVRGLLGVTVDEIEDSTLELPVYSINLSEALREISTELEPLYLTYAAAGYTSLTTTQKRFYDLMQVYSAYQVAVQFLDAMPMFAMKSEQDARASYERIEAAFDRVSSAVRAGYQLAQKRLTDAFNAVAVTPVTGFTFTRSMTSSAPLATDPVTNA